MSKAMSVLRLKPWTFLQGLSNVVLRHDLADKPPTMSEANPHLVFHGFTAKTGLRLKTILQAWNRR
jgi:U3 small nucleolar ribonucleoprotein protein IMP4